MRICSKSRQSALQYSDFLLSSVSQENLHCHVGHHPNTHASVFVFIKNKMPPKNGISITLKGKQRGFDCTGEGRELNFGIVKIQNLC